MNVANEMCTNKSGLEECVQVTICMYWREGMSMHVVQVLTEDTTRGYTERAIIS